MSDYTDSEGNELKAGDRFTATFDGYPGARDIEDDYDYQLIEQDGMLMVKDEYGGVDLAFKFFGIHADCYIKKKP